MRSSADWRLTSATRSLLSLLLAERSLALYAAVTMKLESMQPHANNEDRREAFREDPCAQSFPPTPSRAP